MRNVDTIPHGAFVVGAARFWAAGRPSARSSGCRVSLPSCDDVRGRRKEPVNDGIRLHLVLMVHAGAFPFAASLPISEKGLLNN